MKYKCNWIKQPSQANLQVCQLSGHKAARLSRLEHKVSPSIRSGFVGGVRLHTNRQHQKDCRNARGAAPPKPPAEAYADAEKAAKQAGRSFVRAGHLGAPGSATPHRIRRTTAKGGRQPGNLTRCVRHTNGNGWQVWLRLRAAVSLAVILGQYCRRTAVDVGGDCVIG